MPHGPYADRNQTQVLDVARGYVERGLPISMIVIDWFHWKEMGDWQLDPACWPEPKAMVDELTKENESKISKISKITEENEHLESEKSQAKLTCRIHGWCCVADHGLALHGHERVDPLGRVLREGLPRDEPQHGQRLQHARRPADQRQRHLRR